MARVGPNYMMYHKLNEDVEFCHIHVYPTIACRHARLWRAWMTAEALTFFEKVDTICMKI
jgi:hypothetical protein